MDQKNTIVKCKTHPNCLFNHNGICDNYVINIGEDGKCESYVETATEEKRNVFTDIWTVKTQLFERDSKEPFLTLKEPSRSQRAKCDFINDGVDQEIVNKVCKPFDTKSSATTTLKYNVYDNACDVSFLKEDLEKIQQTLKQDSIPCTMKVAELNKPNKNRSVISDWDYAVTPDICKTCKKVVYGHYCKYKDITNGVWACYERDESIKRAGTLNECWWCDFFNSEKRSCKHKDPDIDRYGCHSSQSTGGNR